MKVGKKELSKKSLLLPWFLIETFKFFISYKALRFYDKVRIIARLLFRWILASYIPFYLWALLGMLKTFVGWGGLANAIRPVFVLFVLPLPVVVPMDQGNLAGWGLCLLFDVFWVGCCYLALNVMFILGVKMERIDMRWRKACLRVGLWCAENTTDEADSGQEVDRRELPKVLSIQVGKLIIDGRGVTVEKINERRAELSSAAGLFFGNVQYVTKADGSSSANLIEISYSFSDLPGRVPFSAVPVCHPGEVILGYSWQGWEVASWEALLHCGIAGETGAGKSIFLRQLITQIMCTDRDAVIIALDFKGSSELGFFQQHGNLVCFDEIGAATQALEIANEIYDERVGIVRKNLCDSIFELQRLTGLRLAPVFIFLDEAAEFFSDKKAGRAVALVDRLIRLGRFCGVHLVVSTQRGDAEVLPTKFRSMLVTRISFRSSQREDSILWLGTQASVKLRRIPGRYLLKGGNGELKELQSPYLSKNEAVEILGRVQKAEYNETVERLRAVAREQESNVEVAEVGMLAEVAEVDQVEGWMVQEVA